MKKKDKIINIVKLEADKFVKEWMDNIDKELFESEPNGLDALVTKKE